MWLEHTWRAKESSHSNSNKFSWYHCAELDYISAKRKRLDGEIVPVRAQHSRTSGDYEGKNGASQAIDLELKTNSRTTRGSDGKYWLQLKLDRLYCVEKVIEYDYDGTIIYNWTCTDKDCSNCVGPSCNEFALTVTSEKAVVKILPPVTDCKYGDAVKLARPSNVDSAFRVYEITIIGKQGTATYWHAKKILIYQCVKLFVK
jgi:hypothetical protein